MDPWGPLIYDAKRQSRGWLWEIPPICPPTQELRAELEDVDARVKQEGVEGRLTLAQPDRPQPWHVPLWVCVSSDRLAPST